MSPLRADISWKNNTTNKSLREHCITHRYSLTFHHGGDGAFLLRYHTRRNSPVLTCANSTRCRIRLSFFLLSTLFIYLFPLFFFISFFLLFFFSLFRINTTTSTTIVRTQRHRYIKCNGSASYPYILVSPISYRQCCQSIVSKFSFVLSICRRSLQTGVARGVEIVMKMHFAGVRVEIFAFIFRYFWRLRDSHNLTFFRRHWQRSLVTLRTRLVKRRTYARDGVR